MSIMHSNINTIAAGYGYSGGADSDSVEVNPLFARPKEAKAFSKFSRFRRKEAYRRPPIRWCTTTPCLTATHA